MIFSFCRYFLSYLVSARSRQWLLYLAAAGLLLSSFSLIVLQSTMGGFQANQIRRSKAVEGYAVIRIAEGEETVARSILADLHDRSAPAFLEYEAELLMRNGSIVKPVIVHGIGEGSPPAFLGQEPLQEARIPYALAYEMGLDIGDSFELFSPVHYNHFLQESPRSIGVSVEETIRTDVPEADSFHLWMRLRAVQNLIGKKSVNRIRLYGEDRTGELKAFLGSRYGEKMSLEHWSQRHASLVWSLALENTVMIFLFASMTVLVGLCIVGGLSILYGKIENDLASFWILGASKKNLERANFFFLGSMSFMATCAGLLLGLASLFLIDHYGGEVFSEDFVDQKIPVHVTWQGVALSFAIPYGVSMAFCRFVFRQFKRESNHLQRVRAVGI